MEPEKKEEGKEVEIIMRGSALDFHYHTSIEKAAQVIAFLSRGDGASLPIPSSHPAHFVSPGALHPKSANTSALEAIRASGARTYPQKIAAIAHFIVERDNRETFDAKEVLSLLRRMGDLPRNFTRDLSNAELLGYVSREHNGEYYLTGLGRQEVESLFADAIPASATSKKRKTKKHADEVDSAEESAPEEVPDEIINDGPSFY